MGPRRSLPSRNRGRGNGTLPSIDAMGARLHGGAGERRQPRQDQTVIPAKAGTQSLIDPWCILPWVPAFAGMTSSRRPWESFHPPQNNDI
jgi:hypothetical protein